MNQAIEPDEVRAALEALTRSGEWLQSPRLVQFLHFVVEETLAGRGERLKEIVVGTGVFGRSPDYDPKTDPIVRVEARRLRLKLLEYYSGEGSSRTLRIELPKGTYRPQFLRHVNEAPPPLAASLPAAAPAPSNRAAMGWAVAALLAVLTGAAVFAVRKSAAPATEQPAGATTPPRLLTTQGAYARSPVFSPDGTRIAFSSESSEFHSHIYVLPAAGGEQKAVTSGEVADYFPSWSPDGRSLAFLRRKDPGRLHVMVSPADSSVQAGQEIRIAEVSAASPLEWTSDGKTILASDAAGGERSAACIVAISVNDGMKRPVTASAGCSSLTRGDSHPHIGPDGRQLAFLRAQGGDAMDIVTMPLDGNGTSARVVTSSRTRINGIAWHPDGKSLLASMARTSEPGSLWRVPLDGGAMSRVAEAGLNPLSPAASRAGRGLAFVVRISDTNIWRVRLEGGRAGDPLQLTRSLGLDTSPQFSPDGRLIAWRSGRSGFDEIWVAESDGRNPRQLTELKAPTTGSPRWSPDGTRIVFESRKAGNPDIYVVSASGSGAPVPLTRDVASDSVPSWSRDGRSVYFASNRAGGQWQVWRMDPDGANARQITRNGGFAAFETLDGKSLVYCLSPELGGLRQVPIGGGVEAPLTEAVAPNFWGHWALGPRGVFYSVYGEKGPRAIQHLDLTNSKVTEVLRLQRLPVQWDSGMSVSADDKWLAWSQLDQAGSDIYVLDNFR